MDGKKRERAPIWATQSEPRPAKRRAAPRKLALIILALAALAAGAILLFRRVDLKHFAEKLQTFGGLAGNWRPPLLPSLLVVGILVILLLWKLPRWQVARSKALTNEKAFDRENEARKTLAQILAGGFVLAGLYSSVQTFDLSREGQITDRFTKAIEQIGASDGTMGADGKPKIKLEVRLGGIYALERIARDSERDHWAIMEVLTAYVRERAPYRREDEDARKMSPQAVFDDLMNGKPPLGKDIQAILTVLGRRRTQFDKGTLDLRGTDLRGVRLTGANLSAVEFSGAALSGDLSNADLSYARLIGTDLEGAYLEGANLSHANLYGADLTDAFLREANLSHACLYQAYLSGADLGGAVLFNADLTFARLRALRRSGPVRSPGEPNLLEADLGHVNLLEIFDLTAGDISSAKGDKQTILPDALKRPTNWPKQSYEISSFVCIEMNATKKAAPR